MFSLLAGAPAALFFLAALPLAAQTPQDAALRELVAEVRQLRMALERSAAVIPRLQGTLHRMTLQQEVARAATREWDKARDEVRYSSAFESELTARVSRYEADITRE